MKNKKLLLLALFFITTLAQSQQIRWTKDGSAYTRTEGGEVVAYTLPAQQKTTLITKAQLTPKGAEKPLNVRSYTLSNDDSKALIYTNTKQVWRYDTRGDYWVLDLKTNALFQLGQGKPASSLMFAKFSPDGSKVAYVSEHNLFVEDLATKKIKALTTNGTRRMINGTFDWVYEEEFACRDGFRWSPDGKSIAYWQIDATKIRDFLMINNTDSIYSYNVPVEYPKVGESPSPYKILVANVVTGKTLQMNIEGDPQQTYVPRMEWVPNTNDIIIQQLNRKQNQSKIIVCQAITGKTKTIYTESDEAWIDTKERWADEQEGWEWLKGGKEFLWVSEKDGWRHIYKMDLNGKETLLTKGNYDIVHIPLIDEANGYVYFTGSPQNALQNYLFRIKLDGSAEMQSVLPNAPAGTHNYVLSPNGKFARHTFSSANIQPMTEWINLADHSPLSEKESILTKLTNLKVNKRVEFFKVKTEDGIDIEGWMVKPVNFDSTKRYPIVFNVYGEPASATVKDTYGTGSNNLYNGDMAKDGYIYASVDNRGTPLPRGRAWRKAIYRKIGIVNIRDQAMAVKEIRKWKYVDTTRVAVHGWSGGGSSTLNLLFQYPQFYQTGISVAAVGNQLCYDNIYQERYMGLPQENREDFVNGSPITHAKNLVGNLLYIHGTGDDNVHYQNAEMLVNELIKHNRQFQFMPYPNRSHGIYEGEGTRKHLNTLFTNYLKQNCPPGAK
jgi:dipeptidyl-peptidase-4